MLEKSYLFLVNTYEESEHHNNTAQDDFKRGSLMKYSNGEEYCKYECERPRNLQSDGK